MPPEIVICVHETFLETFRVLTMLSVTKKNEVYMSSFPWLRLYTETLTDKKFKLISAETGLPRPLILGAWCSLLMLAGESPERGQLVYSRGKPIRFSFICDEIGVDEATGQAILDQFIELDMLYIDDGGVYTITKWDERQFRSDDAYARVKKFRDKKKVNADPETPPETVDDNASRNVSETFQETPQSQIQSQIQIPNGIGDKSPASPEKPLKQLMSVFMDETGLRMPHRKKDTGYWWSAIREIYEIVDSDVGKASNLIRGAVKRMRGENLTISTPNSVVNICRAIVSSRVPPNGKSPPQVVSEAIQRLIDQDKTEVYNPLDRS